MKKILPLILIVTLFLSGCGENSSGAEAGTDLSGGILGNTDSEAGNGSGIGNNSGNVVEVDFSADASDMFTDRDYEIGYDESSSIFIQLNGDSIVCDSNDVQISGTTAVITEEGTYILSGTLDDGMIVVNAGEKDKLHLVLDGVSINSETSASLYILEADKVFVTLAADTINTLSNGGSFIAVDDNNIDATVFSKQDLTLNGTGSLTITSPSGHGIVSKDDLVFTSGTYTIESASHGLDANDSVRIANASITIAAGKDGIHAENADDDAQGFIYIASGKLDISAEGDGISAGAYMQIEDGTFDIVTGGGSVNATKQSSDFQGDFRGGTPGMRSETREASADDDSSTSVKAIKASGDLLINGGSFTIDSADDAVHSNGSIIVNGGTFEIASGDDGFHADESLTVTDGTIHISESYEGLEALHLEISGGDITLTASDDGLNAAGGMDSSGFGGGRGNDQFGGGRGMEENAQFGGDRGMGENAQFGGGRGVGGNAQFGGDRGMGGNAQFGGGPGGESASSNGTIVISGGNIYINASGDGIDANGTLEITGGYTTVVGPTQGDTATLDYDVSGTITGGTFIGTGASGMAQTFSSSEQGVVSVNVGNQAAGTEVILTDLAGNVLLTCEPELPFAVVILSSPEIVTGETYMLSVGSSVGEFTAS